MLLDLAVVALLVLFAVVGARTGALRQLVLVAAAALGWLAARGLAPPVAAGLGRWAPAPVARAAAGVLLFFGAFALAAFAGRLLLGAVRRGGGAPGSADRGAGALLGATQAALALWVVLSAWVVVDRPVGPASFRLDPRRSEFADLAREHNVLERWRAAAADRLRRLLRVVQDPRAAARLRADEATRALVEDPRVQRLVGERLDAGSLASSARGVELLSDPAFLERLERAQRRIDEVAER